MRLQLGRKWGRFGLRIRSFAAEAAEADQFRHTHDCFRKEDDPRQAGVGRRSRKQHTTGEPVNTLSESRSRIIWWICLAGMALVLLNALRAVPQVADLLLKADGDDQMRLLQVRDWLAGQGWFDTRQYGVLPPEGISMHWSRYLDAGIGAILVAALAIMPAEQAELATVILWPSLLAGLMVLVLAHGTSRLAGPAAAIGALAVFFTWGKLGGEFVAPRIDHHNVQILCGTALFYLALVPGSKRRLGALAGAVTAASLAVGLEMLPLLATIWGLMALRHAFGEPGSGDWLLGFGAALAVTAPLLMAGQTPFAAWAVPYCDELAPPVLALGAVGVVATLVPVLAARLLTGPVARILALLAITAAGLWLAYPVLGGCLAGPYSDVPPQVRAIIEGTVIEALSAPLLLQAQPDLLARVLLPPAVIALLALAAALRLRGRLDAVQSRALVQAFVVVGVGMAFATVQIRAANLLTPAVPFLGGFLVQAFARIPQGNILRVPAIAVLVLALPATIEKAAVSLLRPTATPAAAGAAAAGTTAAANCRTPAAIAEIASLPTSLLFPTLNLGPTILTYTAHSVTSAGYHRSPDAFWNGNGALRTQAGLRAALARSGAGFVVLCAGNAPELTSPFFTALRAGVLPPWLSDATADRELVRVFRVDKAALAATGAAP